MSIVERAAQVVEQLQAQNPQGTSNFLMGGINAIKNNDAAAGEKIANQILQQVGMSREQAMNIARQRGLIR